ncbi:MAG: DUF6199 family natural product biosynthesis protein [Bacillota bacterium]
MNKKHEKHNLKHAWLLPAASAATPVPPGAQNSILFFGLFMLAIGLLTIIYPRLFWYLRVGRKIAVAGAAPSRLYLLVLRFGGILLCVLAGWMIWYSR